MRQIVQSYRTGELKLREVAPPVAAAGHLLVQAHYSAVSLGTEGKKVATARQSLLGKARSRPDLVRQVLQTAQREGIGPTYQKVMNRLDEPVSLGYSAAGTVVAVGPGVAGFRVGDRVACAGEGAAHAEVMAVPASLCAKVPEGVGLDHAAFTTLGAIALQGVRQAEVTLGECVAVAGLGLVGQLAVQLLKANGCRVVGIDLDPARVAAARKSGADLALARGDGNLEAAVSALTRGFGVDAVLITAATPSNDPVEMAVALSRDRGRIVVVGAVKLDLPRDPCYQKELELRLSRSYGPGRYDPLYEQRGVDYPIGYVRWTEGRNMEAFLDLLAAGKLDLDALITHRFPFDRAEEAYALLVGRQEGPAPLGILFEYDTGKDPLATPVQKLPVEARNGSRPRRIEAPVGVGFIGAGSFARKHLIPPVAGHPGARLVGVATATGISGQGVAQKFGFSHSTCDYPRLLEDPEVDAVFVATRHDLHAEAAVRALGAGKAVFVEKPLALDAEQLRLVVEALNRRPTESRADLMVGFNRRFAPFTGEIRDFFAGRVEPMVVHYRVNAGFVEGKHWTQDPEQGGGRILGEACHFIDWILHLVGAPVTSVSTVGLDNLGRYRDDNVSITLTFADSSIGTVLYLANGASSLPKERVEVFCQGATAVLDDFRRLELCRGNSRKVRTGAQDKGHRSEVLAFLEAVHRGEELPISAAECVNSTLVTLRAAESLRLGTPLRFGDP